jgi:hypothetical protein
LGSFDERGNKVRQGYIIDWYQTTCVLSGAFKNNEAMERRQVEIPRVAIADESGKALKMAFNDIAPQ